MLACLLMAIMEAVEPANQSVDRKIGVNQTDIHTYRRVLDSPDLASSTDL